MENDNQKPNRFAMLPAFVLDSIYEDYSLDAITKIRKEYLDGDLKKNEALKDMIAHSILKDIKIEQLVETSRENLGLSEEQSKEVALIILQEIFFPIDSFFPGIKDEILKLGGEVPKERPRKLSEQLLRREEEMDKMREEEERKEAERMADTIISKPIEELLKDFPVVGSQQIGSQESIIVKTKPLPMKPLIKFWVEDYKEKMGYYNHTNLERVQYVYHDKNTKNMNEEERRQLGLILKSIDEKIPLPYSTKTRKIDFSRME